MCRVQQSGSPEGSQRNQARLEKNYISNVDILDLYQSRAGRAFAVKVAAKRLPVFPFSGFGLYHHFRNDAFYDLYNLLTAGKSFCVNLYRRRSSYAGGPSGMKRLWLRVVKQLIFPGT